jgi:hypothetical protein
MIKGLQGVQGISVSGGNTSVPYININDSNPMQGMVRVHGNDMQVYDGNNWIQMASSYATVGLDQPTQSLLKWCEAQQNMSYRRLELAQKHPALEKALEAIKRAEDNFETLSKIITSEEYNV